MYFFHLKQFICIEPVVFFFLLLYFPEGIVELILLLLLFFHLFQIIEKILVCVDDNSQRRSTTKFGINDAHSLINFRGLLEVVNKPIVHLQLQCPKNTQQHK